MKKKKLHSISLRLFCCVFLDGLVWRCVCEKGRWRSSRNHLPTLGCTAGGGPTCMSLPVHKDISPDFAFGLCHKHSCLLRSVCGSLCVYVSVEQEEVGSAGSLKNWGLLVLWSCRVTKTWMMTEQIKRSDKYKKGDTKWEQEGEVSNALLPPVSSFIWSQLWLTDWGAELFISVARGVKAKRRTPHSKRKNF